MGWCSGTEIFDRMTDIILGYNLADSNKRRSILELAKVLEGQDWDCQSDSSYYDDPIVKSVFKELHPSWFEDEDKDYRTLLVELRSKFSEIENSINDSIVKQDDLNIIKDIANNSKIIISHILGNL